MKMEFDEIILMTLLIVALVLNTASFIVSVVRGDFVWTVIGGICVAFLVEAIYDLHVNL